MSRSAEHLLQDLSLLLELCLAGGEVGDLDSYAERLIDRAVMRTYAANGLIFVRAELLSPRPGRATGSFRALPIRRAQYLIPTTEVDGVSAGIEAALAARAMSIVSGDESSGHRASFPGLDPPRAALRLAIRDVALLELYTTEVGILDAHTARVLGTLTDWLAGQIRASACAEVHEGRARALDDARGALDALLAATPGVVWRADAHDRLTYVSRASGEILGLDAERLIREPQLRLAGILCEDRERIGPELAERLAERHESVVRRYRFRRGAHATGALLSLEERLRLSYDAEGRLTSTTGLITIAQELLIPLDAVRSPSAEAAGPTERARAERAEAERDAATARAEAQTELLDLLSHELRAPLFPIIALSDLLVREPGELLGSEGREHLQMIHAAGKEMLQLVTDLLDISRVDAGRIRPDPGLLALPRFVHSIVDLHRDRAAERGVELIVEALGAGRGIEVYTERTAAGRIGSCLVAHAIEAASGPVRLTADVASDPTRVRLAVRIGGAPLARLDASRLFEPFSERDGERRGQARRSGLGLVLAKRLAEAVGGTASARSLGDEAVIEVELPAARLIPGPPPPDPARVILAGPLPRIFSCALKLHALGAEPTIVQNDAELAVAERLGPADLVFADARWPGLPELALRARLVILAAPDDVLPRADLRATRILPLSPSTDTLRALLDHRAD